MLSSVLKTSNNLRCCCFIQRSSFHKFTITEAIYRGSVGVKCPPAYVPLSMSKLEHPQEGSVECVMDCAENNSLAGHAT